MADDLSDDQRATLKSAFDAASLSVEELWMRYSSMGGAAGLTEIEAYISGVMTFTDLQHDILAHAINERLDELLPPRAPYRADSWYGQEDTDH